MKDAVLQWMFSHDTGASSKAIVAFMEGVTPERWGYSHPLDASDLGRCLRLLAIAPEYRARLATMQTVSPEWAALIAHWDELESLYNEETGTNGRKCYDRMRELLDPIVDAKMKEQRERWLAEREARGQ